MENDNKISEEQINEKRTEYSNNIETQIKLSILKNEINTELSLKYGIKKETVIKLNDLKLETNHITKENFKEHIKNVDGFNENERKEILSLSKKKLDSLYNSILGAEKLLKKEIVEEIEFVYVPQDGFSKKLFPKSYEKAQNPNTITDQIIGFGLGSLDSIISTSKLIYDIGAGIIKSPRDLVLIVSDKGTYGDLTRGKFIAYSALTSGIAGGMIAYMLM